MLEYALLLWPVYPTVCLHNMYMLKRGKWILDERWLLVWWDREKESESQGLANGVELRRRRRWRDSPLENPDFHFEFACVLLMSQESIDTHAFLALPLSLSPQVSPTHGVDPIPSKSHCLVLDTKDTMILLFSSSCLDGSLASSLLFSAFLVLVSA